jgi:CxxC motif-containing protein (DUF1111 family)
MVSPRLALPIIGMGLLQAIPEDYILGLADLDDDDGDGISGRPNLVAGALGRFGWKANVANVEQQVAAAFLGDIGITSDLAPNESCTSAQTACQEAPHGGTPEIESELFDQVVFYSKTLAVPARRDLDDPDVRAGARQFLDLGCASCHQPSHVTGDDDNPALAGQVIFPYTDLLLHDMGPDLSDVRPDGLAGGSEWRTPPLWGLGLNEAVNGHEFFLHDGRARSVEEAILWHGGEAETSKNGFVNLTAEQREQLLSFLGSL